MKIDKRNWLFLLCCVVLLTACSQVSPSTPGNSALAETTEALETPLSQRFRSMAAGSYGTCLIIAPDGSLVGWGANENGELPGVNSSLSFEERQVFLENMQEVYTGYSMDAALGQNGTLYVWATQQDRGLGHADAQTTPYPEVYAVMDEVQMADTGMGYAAAIREDGSLWVWGNNDYGQLGNGTTGGGHFQPEKRMDHAAFIYCDLFDTYVITQDHELYTFGCIGGSVPKQIASDVVDISTSSVGISILTTDNKVYIGTVSESDSISWEPYAENAQRLLPGGYVDREGVLWLFQREEKPMQVVEDVVDGSFYHENTYLCLTSDGTLREIDLETGKELWNWPWYHILP